MNDITNQSIRSALPPGDFWHSPLAPLMGNAALSSECVVLALLG